MAGHFVQTLGKLLAAAAGAWPLIAQTTPAAADTYLVTLHPEARQTPATGRVILFFITETGRRWSQRQPAEGPFWENPQPIASVAVEDLEPGASVVIDGAAIAFPGSLDQLTGPVRVQAVLDADYTQRDHLAGPGNVLSEVVEARLDAQAEDHVELVLNRPIGPPRPMEERANLKWVRQRSELLSAFYGRDVYHRAGVALPTAYDDPQAAPRQWPTVYVIPGFGGRQEGAALYARMLSTPGAEDIAPIAVHVVLDPESPLAHHGFVDSANNGPRGTALVTELIPLLERRFRLAPNPDARIVTGHSSGGFSALWLQLNHPETFGACWATAPDPIDFSAMITCDLYTNANLYFDADGRERPGCRRLVSARGDMQVTMTMREECLMEFAMDPIGRSGQQWDTWESMFSPRDARTALPRPMFDSITGAIDRDVVCTWSRFDLAGLVEADWRRCGPIVTQRVRLLCGDLDSYYLDRAVKKFKAKVERLAEESGGWNGSGYIHIEPFATHNTITSKVFQRVNEEMREYLRGRGLAQPPLPGNADR